MGAWADAHTNTRAHAHTHTNTRTQTDTVAQTAGKQCRDSHMEMSRSALFDVAGEGLS